MTTLLRPDDTSIHGVELVRTPAFKGNPYRIEKRPGVIRLAREQANGAVVSIVFHPSDAVLIGEQLAYAGRLYLEGAE